MKSFCFFGHAFIQLYLYLCQDYQSRMNAGFSNVCEIFKVRGIESLKYIRECYCVDISTPRKHDAEWNEL